jgi:hypothetical protein
MLKFIRWAAQAGQEAESVKKSKYASTATGLIATPVKIQNEIDDHPGLNFTVYNAVGGKVVQIRSYNTTTDRHKSMLYVITDKEDLGYEVGQIITMERLSS